MATNSMWGQPPRLTTDASGNTVLVGADGENFVLEITALPATGIAVTDTANLNAVVTTVGLAGGGIVRVPVGAYVVNDHIAMKSGVQLIGSGYGSKITLANNVNKNIIYAENVDNIAIKNLHLDGNKANNVDNNPNDSVQNCIAVQGALNRVEISGNWITNAIFHGVFVSAVTTENMIVTNNTIYGNGYRPIHMHGTTSVTVKNVRVTDNTCHDNGQHVSSWNVKLSGIFVAFLNMDAVLVANNLIYNECGTGIDITGANAAETGGVYGVEITGNVVKNCYIGIQLSNSSSVASTLAGVNISGNQIYNTHTVGILLSTSNAAAVTRNINITGNVLINTAPPISTTLAADYTSGATFTVVDGSLIQVGMPIVVTGASWSGAIARVIAKAGNNITVDVDNTNSLAIGAAVHSGLNKVGITFGVVSGLMEYLNITGNTIQGFGGDTSISGLASAGFLCTSAVHNSNFVGNMVVANEMIGTAGKLTYQFRITGAATYWNISGNTFVGTSNTSTITVDIGSSASYIMFTNNLCKRAGTSSPVTFSATSSLIANIIGGAITTVAADAASGRMLAEATGSGSAALGANCPAVTAAAPFTWERIKTKDNSDGFIPVWK